MTKKVLFIFANRPLPLQLHINRMLQNTGRYDVEFCYMNRSGSPVSVPMPGELLEIRCSSITWPDGSSLPAKVLNRFIFFSLFVKKIVTVTPDIVHAWNLEMLLCSCIAKCLRWRIKIIFTLQDTTEWMLRADIRYLQRFLYRVPHAFFVTSQGFETNFLRRFSLINNDKKVVYVPNAPPRQLLNDFRKKTCSTELVVGYIGAFKGALGIKTLVKAAELCRQKKLDVKILFAGIGLDRPLVEQLAEKNDFVRYVGPYKYDEILSIYSKVDVLYAAYNDSYDKRIHTPYRLSEGVCLGLPIIALKDSHVANIVERNGIGMSVELGDVGSLALCLEKLTTNTKEREEIFINTLKIRDEHILENYYSQIKNTYDKVAS